MNTKYGILLIGFGLLLFFAFVGTASAKTTPIINEYTNHTGDLVISDNETFIIENCTYIQTGNVTVTDNATLIVKNATLLLNATGWDQYYILIERFGNLKSEEATVGQGPTYSQYIQIKDKGNASIKSSIVHGVECFNSSTVNISDSMVAGSDGVICVDNSIVLISNSSMGWLSCVHNSTVSVYNSSYVDCFCAGYNSTLYILDSRARIAIFVHTSLIHISNTTITEGFMFGMEHPGYFNGVLDLDKATLGVVDRYSVIVVYASNFFMYGSIIFIESGELTVQWDNSTIIRNYDVLCLDQNNDPIQNANIELYAPNETLIWNGTSDEQGMVNFNITFTNDNYNDTWILNVTKEERNGTKEIRLLSSTPVILKLSEVFDIGQPENPYPSIFGTHNGTIKPSHDVNVSRMFTYPCTGTGGHSEYVRIYNESGTLAEGYWSSYRGDYHNITLMPSITLLKDHEYNYTIITGSYPQIHHTDRLEIDEGVITCDNFVDANGKIYYDWIPAIRLESL